MYKYTTYITYINIHNISIYLPTYLSVYLSIYLSFYLSIYLYDLFLNLFIYTCIHTYIYMRECVIFPCTLTMAPGQGVRPGCRPGRLRLCLGLAAGPWGAQGRKEAAKMVGKKVGQMMDKLDQLSEFMEFSWENMVEEWWINCKLGVGDTWKNTNDKSGYTA